MRTRSPSVESSVKMETSQRIIRDPTHECDKCGKTLQFYLHFLEVRKPQNKIRVTKSQNRTQNLFSITIFILERTSLFQIQATSIGAPILLNVQRRESVGRGIHQHPSTTQYPLTHMQQTLYKHNKCECFHKNKAHSTSENSHWRKTICM